MIHTDGIWFKDEQGRTLILRGVNLGGSTKVPLKPDGATHHREGFFDHRQVSFVGRPFPLEQADEHFSRLRQWGLTFLRFLVTWEAIEHAGPGTYDQEYLDYVHALVEKAAEYGFAVFIDPHQDVWSRFSGGDGAPGWTLEAVGFDLPHLHETGATFLHQIHGDPFPHMMWPTNEQKLACATMFTLFFAGNDFAPATRIDGEPVQEYLQRHYIAAIQQVARRLRDLPNVVGYDTLNEPSAGWIGRADVRRVPGPLKIGASPSPLQSMLLGAGFPQEVGIWKLGLTGLRRVRKQVLNPGRQRAWLPERECVWKQNGVWEMDASGSPRLLRPDYFASVGDRLVDFDRDYLRPFANRYAAAIREVAPEALIFVETEPIRIPPSWGNEDAQRIVSAPHWYDGAVMLLKTFHSWFGVNALRRRPVIGRGNIRKSYAAQLGAFKQAASDRMGGVPTLIGEFGIVYDMDHQRAYRSGDFSAQVQAMDRSMRAMEDNRLSFTIWNYTADNTNAHGDQWNGEDFSIFSRDQQRHPADINSGGRALEAVVRPYARAVAGEPLRMSFDLRERVFEFEFRHDPLVAAPSEFFIPDYQYPQGYAVEVSDGSYEMDEGQQLLIYHHSLEHPVHRVRVKR